jgi:hypothetical protein
LLFLFCRILLHFYRFLFVSLPWGTPLGVKTNGAYILARKYKRKHQGHGPLHDDKYRQGTSI